MTNYQTDPARKTTPPRSDYVPPVTPRRDASNAALYAGLLALVVIALIAWFALDRGSDTTATDVNVTTEAPAADVAPATPPVVTDPVTDPATAPATTPADPATNAPTLDSSPDAGSTGTGTGTGTTQPVTPAPAD